MLVPLITVLACASFSLANNMAGVRDFNTLSYEDVLTLFENFVQTYERHYQDASETIMRLRVFTNSLQKIVELNKKAPKPIFGITKFADYTQEELDEMFPVIEDLNDYSLCKQNSYNGSSVDLAPEELDWRDRGAVTGVKNQARCGSCWAFATIGAVEGSQVLAGKPLLALSEQQLVDCDTETNNGCNGGLAMRAIEYVVKKGIASEQDYPYQSGSGGTFDCKEDSVQPAAKISACVLHTLSDEDALIEVLAKSGPLAISVHFGDELALYKEGVLEDCPAKKVNHAVLLVGYGTENGVPYWIVKNSHGRNYGEEGYFRVKRHINACNMLYRPAVQAVP